MKIIISILVSAFILISTNLDLSKPKKFPKLEHYTVKGEMITNDYFKENEKTLVVHGFIGCEGMMYVLKDLQVLEKEGENFPNVLLIFENSINQFNNFNDTIVTPLSKLREYYDLEPITYDVIAECGETTMKSKNGDIEIGSECRKLGRKLQTRSSPTTFLVNSTGEIIKKEKSYHTKKDWLFNFINQ